MTDGGHRPERPLPTAYTTTEAAIDAGLLRGLDPMTEIEHYKVRVCTACGRRMDGWTGCLGTVSNRHPLNSGRFVEVVPLAALEGAVDALKRIAFNMEDPRPGWQIATDWLTEHGHVDPPPAGERAA